MGFGSFDQTWMLDESPGKLLFCDESGDGQVVRIPAVGVILSVTSPVCALMS